LDIFFTKTAANTREMTVFQQPDASATTSFPYGTAGSAPLSTTTLTFEPTTGKLATPADGLLEIDMPAINGQEIEFDISSMTELATEYTPGEIDRNGNGPAAIDKVVIGNDGNVYAQYANGATAALYRLPLANVASPDRLQVLPGNVFAPGLESG